MRSEIGNCLAIGGFCTSVSKEICEALQNAYTNGKHSVEASEDAISREWVLNEIITKVEDDDSLTDEQRGPLSAVKHLVRHAPPVVPSAVPQQKRANKLSGTSEKQEEEAKP